MVVGRVDGFEANNNSVGQRALASRKGEGQDRVCRLFTAVDAMYTLDGAKSLSSYPASDVE